MSDPTPQTASSSTPTVPFVFKRKSRPQSSRRRSPSPSANPSSTPSHPNEASSSVIKPTQRTALNPLLQGTKRLREARKRERDADEQFRADESFQVGGDELVTRSNDWDVSASSSDSPQIKRPRLDDDGNILPPASDGTYKGQASYSNFIKLDERQAQMSSKMKAGPQKASANIRSITVTDYQPDVCKDYKETGFCGYGDSCKFLHDRGDYLAGWQMDKLAVNPTTGRHELTAKEEEEEEEVPFGCLICRKPFTEPVVTKCGHYFCMNCAITRFAKTPKCYACGTPTGGMFNKAEKILAKLEKRNEELRERKRREKEERGESDSEPEDGGDGGEVEGIEFGGGESEEE